MLESEIEKYLVKRVKQIGGKAYKFTSPAHRGVPDRILVLPRGHVIFCEVKNERGRLSVLQQIELQWMKSLGHRVAVVYSIEDIDALMEYIDEFCG